VDGKHAHVVHFALLTPFPGRRIKKEAMVISQALDGQLDGRVSLRGRVGRSGEQEGIVP